MFCCSRVPEEGRIIECIHNARSGQTAGVHDWSYRIRHGDPKNAYGIVVNARMEATYMDNICV